MHECRAAIRVFVLCSRTAADPERALPELDESNKVTLIRRRIRITEARIVAPP